MAEINPKDIPILRDMVAWYRRNKNPNPPPRPIRVPRMLGGGLGNVFAVKMQEVGGEEGDAETEASWIYDVTKYGQSEILFSHLNPGIAPHQAYRGGPGRMQRATSGTATYDNDELIILTTNERRIYRACGDDEIDPNEERLPRG